MTNLLTTPIQAGSIFSAAQSAAVNVAGGLTSNCTICSVGLVVRRAMKFPSLRRKLLAGRTLFFTASFWICGPGRGPMYSQSTTAPPLPWPRIFTA
ncbi:hypothetical protein DL95DRAFT_387841, partial [Leptodontidium sp. 2 PMI_412]